MNGDCDYDFFAGRSRHFPVRVPKAALRGKKIRLEHGRWDPPEDLHPKANLSLKAWRYLERMGYGDPDEDGESAAALWHYALAILHTPSYVKSNRAALRQGWPRLPIPEWKNRTPSPEAVRVFRRYADLGKQIRELLSGGDSAFLRAVPDAGILRRIRGNTPISADSTNHNL